MMKTIESVLDYLSRKLRIDFHYIFKGGLYSVSAQFFVGLSSFALSVAFAHLLAKEDFGRFQYILSIGQFIGLFALTGLGTTLVKSTARGYEGTLYFAFWTYLKWGLPSILCGTGIGIYYLIQEDFLLGWGIIIINTASTLVAAAKLYAPFQSGKKLFLENGIATVTGSIVPNIALVSCLFLSTNVITIILVYALSHTLVNLYLFTKALRRAENDQVDKTAIPQSIHLTLQDIIQTVPGQIDKVILFQFSGSAALADLIFATTVPEQIKYYFKATKQLILPKVSVRSISSLKEDFLRKIFLLYVVIIPIILIYIVLSPYFFSIFFPQYTSAVLYSQVYSLLFLVFPISLLNYVFIAHEQQKILYKISVSSSIIKVVSTVTFVPLFGMWGVLLSIMILRFYSSGTILYYFIKLKE